MSNVLISGGSRGIGAALVRLFSSKGHKVAFIYNKSDSAANALSGDTGAVMIKGDVSDFDECLKLYNSTEAEIGDIDVLVNCAGISMIAQLCDTDANMWRKVIDTNLTSAFAMSKAASLSMVRRKSGCIVNIGSVWGRVGASCESAYSASKSALRAMTCAHAKELAPSGIRVNCVEPGVIDTEMNACFSDSELKALCDEIPLERLGKASEVAELVYFLASEKASYITGQVIGIDGGFYI